MSAKWMQWRETFAGHTLPCAFVDLDALDANLATVLAQAGSLPVRIASKSVRCSWVLRYLLRSPGLQGLMCFTAAEALWLSRQGFHDLLVGYPTWDEVSVRGLCQEIQQGKRILLMIDQIQQAQWLSAIARSLGVTIPLCIDLDLSQTLPGLHFGVLRSPLQTPEDVLALARACQALPYLHVTALMGYEAQLAGVGDAMPGQVLKNKVIQRLQAWAKPQVLSRRQAVVKALHEAKIPLSVVNGGGSGSLSWTAQDSSVTELTAGSAFFAPTLFDAYRHFRLQPAAGFVLPIVRRPAQGVYTCLGGGYIASGSVGTEKLPQIYLPPGAQLTDLEGAGEVQTPVRYNGSAPLDIGEPVFFRHAKAGELCERFAQLHLLRGGRIVETVPTYRGEGQCFL